MTSNSLPSTRADDAALVSLRTLHIFTLCAFAITQPVLTSLIGQSVYLSDQDVGWLEIGVLLTILSLILPILFLMADRIVVKLSQRFWNPGRYAVIAVLFFAVVLSLLRPYVAIPWLRNTSNAFFVQLVLATVISCVFVFFYERASWLRFWLSYASAGLVVFPGIFLWQFQSMRAAETSVNNPASAKNPMPVVFIVFDEFSGITLLNEQLEINAQCFPQFARLAKTSTWYRNATTVNPRTDIAVPAILSGRFPTIDHHPLAAEYPGNLLQLIEATKDFEMTVFEPVSRLCPDSIRNRYLTKPHRSMPTKCFDLVQTLVAVYPRLIFTRDIPVEFPRIPKSWFGLPSKPIDGWNQYVNFKKGLFRYPGTEFRDLQLRHFLECVEPSEKPRFCFMHTVLPHYPWSFLPSGEQYQSEYAAPPHPSGGGGELGEDWDSDPATVIRNEYRYRLQLGYVDRFIGELLDQLESTRLLDECLLIVTADHGVSFRPGHSRRLPDADNLADILSVPLFIKLPKQSEGRINDRNVESIDLLPTVAEVLGIELPEPVDGNPVSQENHHLRKTFYFEGKMTIIEPDLPQRLSSVKRQTALYGASPLEKLPVLTSSHPEWNGRSISSFEIDEQAIPAKLFNVYNEIPDRQIIPEIRLTPHLISGWIAAEDLSFVPADIVLAVDGFVIDSSKTCWSSRNQHQFQFLTPSILLEEKPGHVELFVVHSNSNSNEHHEKLRRLKAVPEEK